MKIFSFFTDPVLRAPTIGSMLMCLSAALVGVIVFVRKRSLLGEALSHATYPGVTAAIIVAGVFSIESGLGPLLLGGAFISCMLGFWFIERLERKMRVPADAALGVILALFFGVGVTIASFAQNSYTYLFRQTQIWLYGQAATMTDVHILIYGLLCLFVALFIALFYKKIQVLLFDSQFAATNGTASKFLEFILLLMIVLSLVIGIRCVGVILMSAMFIAPAAAARQFTNKLSKMFWLAAIFGCTSAFLGVYFSVVLSETNLGTYSVPTGPMIVLISGSIALYALFFAPKRGLIIRYVRIARFRHTSIGENLIKNLWRLSVQGKKILSFREIALSSCFSSLYLRFQLSGLIRKGELVKEQGYYSLSPLGTKKGARIVRLHRLWEVYLVNSLGLNVERVHKSAEEMEHILTADLEKKLTDLLDNPSVDPHEQPIPGGA